MVYFWYVWLVNLVNFFGFIRECGREQYYKVRILLEVFVVLVVVLYVGISSVFA